MYPLFLLSALKSPAFKLLAKTKLDKKIALLYKLISLPFSQLACFLYPRVHKISDIGDSDRLWGDTDEESGMIVKPLYQPCLFSKSGHYETYLIDNGDWLYCLLGSQGDVDNLIDFFGVNSCAEYEGAWGRAFNPNTETDSGTFLQ